MNKKHAVLVIVSLVVVLGSITMPAEAALRFTTEEEILFPNLGVGVNQMLRSWIEARPSSGYSVYVEEYTLMVYHNQYDIPGVWELPDFGSDLETFTVTFSGNGLSTQTYELVEGGIYSDSDLPDWMEVDVLLNNPRGIHLTAEIPINEAFAGSAEATMTVYVEGIRYILLYGFIPLGVPFESTTSVSCSAYWYLE